PLPAGTIGAEGQQSIPGWTGDGGPATQARLGVVRGLALDDAGDLLVADATNGRIRLITPGGTIWTIAGAGTATVDGDGGAPARAGMRGILGIARDGRGRLFALQGAALDGAGQVR